MTVKAEDVIASVRHIVSNATVMVSYISILLTISVSIEVIGRYVFNHPTSWVWPVSKQLFGILILIALAYTESENGHIRIEILYDHFPKLIKNMADWLSFVVKLSFMAVLTWQSSIMAQNAIALREKASGSFKIPLYPFKTLIFLATLFIACGIAISFVSKKIYNKSEEKM